MHGKQWTVGKTEDEIIAEIFPNITFETYSGLLAKRGQEVIKDQYGMIVLDELHRTGAKEWEGKIDKLLENQTEDVKVLGITATPTRDVDGRDMANETAKKLGYTDEEIKQRKHLASNMTLENAIRMGYVVNPKIVYCKYDLISSGKMDGLRERLDDIEDENERAEQIKKYDELRQQLNKEIDAEIGEEARKKLEEEARKKLEEEARKNLDKGIGKEEILRQNVKKGGKYIVFIPVTDQGDIEDENGNRIGNKTGADKIKAYQDYLKKVFEGTEIVPQLHSLLGSYSKEKNKEEIDAFESDDSEETKFMVVMNKANEGVHIDGVDGIVWLIALDENSKIKYLQQLGRAIYALDEDNPLPDDKRPIIIDLVNNSLTVKIEKEFGNAEPIDDLEALTIVKEWMEEHDGILPYRNSSNKQEQHYYAVLRRIQNKYTKYLDGFDNFEDLTEEDKSRIQEIIDLASEIDLWNIELPPIPKSMGNNDEINPFEITGILKDYIEFEDEIEKITHSNKLLKNALEIENWCQTNYANKAIWDRKLPSSNSKDEEEKRLGTTLVGLRQKTKQYEGKKLEEIENEEDRIIIEIIRRLDRNYAYGEQQLHCNLGRVLEIENWCKENYGKKKIWERKLPTTTLENKEERRLGKALEALRRKMKQYEGKKLEEIENEEDRKIVEIIRQIDGEYAYGETQLHHNLGQVLEIENWCKENYGEKKIWKRSLPITTAKDEEEKRLGSTLAILRKKMKQYEAKKLEEIENEEDRRVVEIIRRLDEEYAYEHTQLHHNLGRVLEIENWCKENYGEKKIWERKLPRRNSKNEEEKRLGMALGNLKIKMKQYEGKKLEEIENEEDRKIVEIIRQIDGEYAYGEKQLHYNLGRALEIENWCETNYGKKAIWDRKLPSSTSKDEEEKRLGMALGNLKIKMKQYEGKKLEEIENEEDRKIVEIVRRLDDEYNPRRIKKLTLQRARAGRDEARGKKEQAQKLQQQVSKELEKRGQIHDE